MNWEFIVEYLPLYEKATVLTVRIGLLGIAFAMVQYHRIPVVRQIVAVYIELSRNTPLLVQLFFIYYGLQKVGLQLSLEICGVAGLAFLGGSYMAEAFRSGLESVETIQRESAISNFTAGTCDKRACICSECYFPAQRNQCIECHQSYGFNIYGERPDRSLL